MFLTEEDFDTHVSAAVAKQADDRLSKVMVAASLDDRAGQQLIDRYRLSLRAHARSTITIARELFRSGRTARAIYTVDAAREYPDEVFLFYDEGRGHHTVTVDFTAQLLSFVSAEELVKVDIRPFMRRNPSEHRYDLAGLEFDVWLRYVSPYASNRDPMA